MNLLNADKSPDNADGAKGGLEAYVPDVADAEKAAEAPTKPTDGAGNDAGGLRVSLMLSDTEGTHGPNVGRSVLILVLVLVLETAALGTGYYLLMRKEMSLKVTKLSVQQDLQVEEQKVTDAEAAAHDVVAFFSQVKASQEALDGHVYWTSFYTFIEQQTRTAVRYLNFSGDSNSGVVTVDARGLTYRDVAEQIVQLRENPMVKDLRTTSAAASIDQLGNVTGVTFSIVLTLDPAVWKKTQFSAATNKMLNLTAEQPALSSDVTGSVSSATAVVTPSRADASSTAPVTGRSVLNSGTTSSDSTRIQNPPNPQDIQLK